MWQFLMIMVAVAAAIFALKVALIILFLAGIIFKTKETLSLLVVLGALALLRNYPVACAVVAGLATIAALAKIGSKEKASKVPDATGD